MTKKINVRNKGLNYERKIAQELRALFGDDDIGTSRNKNRFMDSQKVDIIDVPMCNIQCKATEATPSYHSLLKQMPKDTNYNIIFHKRNKQGEVVVMDKESFYEIIRMLKYNKII